MKNFSKKSGRKFYKKVLTVSIVTIITISSIVSYTVYSLLNNSIERTVERFETANAQLIYHNFENSVNTVCSISGYLATLNSLPIDYMDKTANQWVKTAISSTINSYLLNYSYISSIHTNIGNTPFSAGVRHDGEFVKLTQYNGFEISICTDDSWPHFFQFESIDSNYNINRTVIQIKSEILSESVFSSNNSRQEYITDSTGTVILSNNGGAIFDNLKSFCEVDIENTTSYFSLNNSFGKKKYVTAECDVNSMPFIYISEIDADYYLALTRIALIQSIFIGIVLTVLSVILVYLIVKYTYKPIREISETFTHYYPDVQIMENEIEFINSQIRNTIKEKRNLEEKLPETIERLNRSQIAALQSQINPHFLFNTLENIKGLSVSNYGIDNEIEKSLILLDTILCESINQKNILSSVEEEIHITKTYIELMRLRFGDIFTVDWNIPDDCLYHAKIIRFTLQPIIENCFLKGFDRKRTDNKISILIVEADGNIEISISDNGKGIEPKLLEKIKSTLSDSENFESDHVGLKNINLRIKLLFGYDYGITDIESDNGGTVVKIKIPLIKT